MRITILLILLLSSCFTSLKTRERRHQVVQKNYDLGDSLHISTVFLCNYNRLGQDSIREVRINRDSVFSIFKNSLSKLNLPIIYHDIDYHCDDKLLKNYYMKISKIDTCKILDLTRNKKESVHLTVVLSLEKWDVSNWSFTPRLVPNRQEQRVYYIQLVVFIIKRNTITYSRQFTFCGDVLDIDYLNLDPKTNINQKHWDELVEKTMKDYVKRLN
jgi:hypothetical protein